MISYLNKILSELKTKSSGKIDLYLLLLAVLPIKILRGISTYCYGNDGAFYFDVARNFRDGNGISTGISLFNKGYQSFPHPTGVYPFWPALLGLFSKAFPIRVLAVLLPSLFYFLSIVVYYCWANRLFRKFERNTVLFRFFTPGFIAAVLFATHREYFVYTSQPYTEGLSYFVLGIFLYRMLSLLDSPKIYAGIEIGIWFVLMLLCRYQLLVFILGTLAALACCSVLSRGRRTKMLLMAGSAGGIFLVFTYVYVNFYLGRFLSNATVFNFIRFEQIRASNILSTMGNAFLVKDSLAEFILDRIDGLLLSFSFSGKYAYSSSFYFFQYGILLFLLYGVLLAARSIWNCAIRREKISSLTLYCKQVLSNPHILFLSLFSMAGFVSIHLIHKKLWASWNFSMRHGITSAFVFLLSTTVLYTSRSRIMRVLSTAIVVLSLVVGIYKVSDSEYMSYSKTHRERFHAEIDSLGIWIDEMANRKGSPILLAMNYNSQQLLPRTSNAYVHWLMYSKKRLLHVGDLNHLIDDFGVEYFVLRNASFFGIESLRLRTRLQPVHVPGAKIYKVFRTRKDSSY